MKKLFTVVYGSFITFALVAAPTANEDFVIEEAANAYTNALRDAKEYTDGQIRAIPAPDFSTSNATLVATIEETAPEPDFSTSNATLVATIEATAPEPDFSTSNATLVATIEETAPAPGDYASVSNRAMNALPATARKIGTHTHYTVESPINISSGLTFASGGYLSVSAIYHPADGILTVPYGKTGDIATTSDIADAAISSTNYTDAATNALATVATSGSYDDLANKPTIPANAADVGAYPSASGNALAGQVATIGAHLNAEDARVVVTNYDSAVTIPSASLQISQDGDWMEIWNELTRWGDFYDRWVPSNIYTRTQVDAALAGKADCAWGFYDSHTGEYAPDGYTWVSSPKIAIAAGLAYQRTVTAEGTVWVLESNGLVTEVGGVVSNGFFRVSDDEGNALFEIVKGNKRTVGAQADSVQVIGAFTPTKLQIVYAVTAEEHPTIEVSASLDNPAWYAETESSCPANVSWSGVSGNYVATVQAKSSSATQLFVKAEYLVGGETYIRNNGPMSVDGGILCTDGIHKVRPVYNNGNVTWEVVQ